MLGGYIGGRAGARFGPRPEGGAEPHPEVFRQEEPNSCGVAAARQVIKGKTGRDIPESVLRDQSRQYPNGYDPERGTNMDGITRQLRENGVPEASDPKPHQTVSMLDDATKNGDPAIANLKNKDGTSHAVTLQRVDTHPDGSRHLVVDDPADGSRTYVPESEFNKRSDGWAITTNR